MRTKSNKIEYGDKILATITTPNGNTLVHITSNSINSIKELMLRVKAETNSNNIRLSNLFIRNYTRGWSMNQPLLIA